jgi:hypothetical protein
MFGVAVKLSEIDGIRWVLKLMFFYEVQMEMDVTVNWTS